MTPTRRPTVADASRRATVSFPGQVPGTTATGALHVVTATHCKVSLKSGAWVIRSIDLVGLVPEADT